MRFLPTRRALDRTGDDYGPLAPSRTTRNMIFSLQGVPRPPRRIPSLRLIIEIPVLRLCPGDLDRGGLRTARTTWRGRQNPRRRPEPCSHDGIAASASALAHR